MFDILYWVQLICFRFLIYLCRLILAIFYWNKGEKVPPLKNPLLRKSAKSLAEDIRNGKLKSRDLIQAYIDRIGEVEPFVNAIVESRFEEALKDADKVDEFIQSGKYSKQQLQETKPLLGVPFTVKVILKVKGLRCTAGAKIFKDLVAEEDAPSVALLKNAGGIVLATTNIPEYGLASETNNLLHGKTCNPYDTSRTSGGSSGGECVLLASGASAVGIGNDMGGSVRIPAHFNGIYAHKSTIDLVPYEGTFPVLHPELAKHVSTGPMCRFAEDLVMMMKILTAENKKSVKVDRKVDFRKLKLFYLTNIKDPKVLPVDKEMVEGIHKAISHFNVTYGVNAQEFKLPLIEKTNDITYHIIQAPIENFVEYITAGKIKDIHVLSEIFKFIIGKSTFSLTSILAYMILNCPLLAKRQNIPYYLDILKSLVKEFNDILDEDSVLLCPIFPETAPYHNELLLILGLCYTSICNLVELPSTAIPIGFNRNGMPQGIQIIAKKNKDELTLACAVELEKVFGGWVPLESG